ncbi:MAG: hypothetical protein LBL35_02090 [Clostridiales bacterium]|jgi:hypothetical protein|nr:hypothetical protein [Clostridiales bacterium]
MYQPKKIKNCKNFRSMNVDGYSPYRHSFDSNCMQCVYFSSRNCGMDVSDSVEPALELFM